MYYMLLFSKHNGSDSSTYIPWTKVEEEEGLHNIYLLRILLGLYG